MGLLSRGTAEERFWSKVDKRGPDDCWEWKGAVCSLGTYGHIKINHRVVIAHRFSYELHIGPLGNLYCLHKCDNPKCVNPKHLFVGTQLDNIEDMRKKGRVPQGETHYRAKLSRERIEAARLYRKNGWSFAKIGARFNVSSVCVYKALSGKSWKNLR